MGLGLYLPAVLNGQRKDNVLALFKGNHREQYYQYLYDSRGYRRELCQTIIQPATIREEKYLGCFTLNPARRRKEKL